MAHLTSQKIETALVAARKGERAELADDREPGLRLRLGRRGARWSTLVRMPTGRRTRVPLGYWPEVDIAEARRKAQSVKGKVLGGQDPNYARYLSNQTLTVGEVYEIYRSIKLPTLRSEKKIAAVLAPMIKILGPRPITSITRREIAELVDRSAPSAPYMANRKLAHLRAFLNWAMQRGHLDDCPAKMIGKPTREIPRERTPTISELCEIWSAAGQLGFPFEPIVKILMLLASRRQEVAAMRREELEIARGPNGLIGVWHIPAERSKNGRSLRVPLAPVICEILLEILMHAKFHAPQDLVFSTNGRSAPSGWSKVKRRLVAKIQEARDAERGGSAPAMPEWRLHDFRRSFVTHACDVLLVDAAVADRCLNHVGAATASTVARIYARNEMFEQRRAALFAWADFLIGRGAAIPARQVSLVTLLPSAAVP